MQPLSFEEARKIIFEIVSAPKCLEPNDYPSLSIRLVNNTSKYLDSFGDTPLHLSYHWLTDDGSVVVVHDGLRTPLPQPVPPGSEENFSLKISTPIDCGTYTLRITLVHENICWFDKYCDMYVDILIVIRKIPWWDESESHNIVFGDLELINQFKFKKYFGYSDGCRPLYLHIETVNLCNLNCIICPNDKMTRKRSIMTTSIFKKTINNYSNMGGGAVIMTPQIGDIFLDKLLLSRIEYLSSMNIKNIGFVTNAVAVDIYSHDNLVTIFDMISRINISIYGLDEEEYFTMTRVGQMYRRVVENILMILAINKKALICFGFRLLRKRNEDEIREWIMSNFHREIPFEYLNSFGNWGGGIDTNVILPWGATWVAQTTKNEPCIYPVVHTKIKVDGSVSFCSCIDYDNIKENLLGNIQDESLFDIYNGKKAKLLHKKGISKCKICTNYVPLSNLEKYFYALENPMRDLGV
jgi:MoaA/NifB/PqqE/SkfB family radical SAM enzyme